LLADITFLQKKSEKKYWIHKVFRTIAEEGEFYALFGRLKDYRHFFLE